jgi:hypothetical protein
MIVSLNEIESLVYKACRGAGMSWGLAEEAAHAARWLSTQQLAWDRSLISLLDLRATVSAPSLQGEEIRAAVPHTALCPIHAGAAVSDLLGRQGRLTLRDVLEPLWLLPFAARHVRGDRDVALMWSGRTIHLGALAPRLAPEILELGANQIPSLTIELLHGRGPVAGLAPKPEAGGAYVNEDSWEKLLRLAALTYVPASDQSRGSGAGAARLDND